MLSYSLLKNHAGLLLTGDHHTLEVLHDILHDVVGRSPLTTGRTGEYFLALAYDVRKAFEGQREIFKPTQSWADLGARYGVRILWPDLLVQHRMLRGSLAFIDSSARHQAVTYDLEFVIEHGLAEDFGDRSREIIDLWRHIDVEDLGIDAEMETRSALFCSWTASERKRRFAGLLLSLPPWYDAGPGQTLRKDIPVPEELAAWAGREMPDPQW